MYNILVSKYKGRDNSRDLETILKLIVRNEHSGSTGSGLGLVREGLL
jgi:hypothetical protein